MRKNLKKLVLNKITLSNLESKNIKGGDKIGISKTRDCAATIIFPCKSLNCNTNDCATDYTECWSIA